VAKRSKRTPGIYELEPGLFTLRSAQGVEVAEVPSGTVCPGHARWRC